MTDLERSRDEAARDRDDAARDRDDVSRGLDAEARALQRDFYFSIKRWSSWATIALCLTLTVLWVAIVARQSIIINRLTEIDTTLDERTVRFERIEKEIQSLEHDKGRRRE